MMQKVRIFDNTFTGFTKSASLREENKDVSPTHFEWVTYGESSGSIFYTDGHIYSRTGAPENAVAWLIEPRCLRPENYEYIERNYSSFKYVLTYDQRLLDAIPNGLFYPLGGSSIAFDRWGMYPKSKSVCMFYSGKDTTEGHKLRKQIVEEFGDRIDVYGAGVGRPVDSKFEVLKDYYFCIVVESCWQRGYFTEKLIDCFSVGTIPIYRASFSQWQLLYSFGFSPFPGRFRDIDGLNISLDLLEQLTCEAYYLSHSNYVEKNFWTSTQYSICENYIYERYKDLFQE